MAEEVNPLNVIDNLLIKYSDNYGCASHSSVQELIATGSNEFADIVVLSDDEDTLDRVFLSSESGLVQSHSPSLINKYNANNKISIVGDNSHSKYNDCAAILENSLSAHTSHQLQNLLNSQMSNENGSELNVKKIKTDSLVTCKASAKLEKAGKKKAIESEKLLKKAEQQIKKHQNVDQCVKLVTAVLDSNLKNNKWISFIKENLDSVEVKYTFEDQLLSDSISWTRIVETVSIDTSQNVPVIERNTTASNEVLIVVDWTKFIKLVNDGALVAHIKSLNNITPQNKSFFLVVIGIDKYFKCQGKPRKCAEFTCGRLPNISRQKLEYALTELQILTSTCYKFVNTGEDLAALVKHFSKSVGQIPFKMKQDMKQRQLNFYAGSDNKDSVHVDYEGNGLHRLWIQQLTTFPMIRMNIAEAIQSVYKSPAALITAYGSLSESEGKQLLQDIRIRRGASAMDSSKRIGPELSRKIYTYFTSRNGCVSL